MLKFCDKTPCALATHLFSITINREGNEYTATAKQLFPETDPDPNLIKNVQLFAFPDSCAMESKSFITFIIGDTHCDFQIGYAFYNNALSARCILSNYYYPNIFESLLNLPDDALLTEVEALSKSEVRKSVQIKKNVFYLDGGRQKQQLLKLVFDTFDPFDISKIIIAMMQARHIFCVSSSASVCCKFAAALPILIEPFCWDMNTIPILPLKLKDVCQVPVPTLIGLTRPEVLLEGRVAPHIIVNSDLRLVIDNPSLDNHDFSKRANVLAHMIKFKNTLSLFLNQWHNCPGFPHKQVQMLIQKFIASYLQIYTGPVSTSEALVAALAKVPEFLESSQVIQGLLSKEHATQSVTEAFEKWFDDIFKPKSNRKTVKLRKKSSDLEINNANNSKKETNSNENLGLKMKSTSQESVNLLEFSKSSINSSNMAVRRNDSSPALMDLNFDVTSDQNGNNTKSEEDSFLINFDDQISTEMESDNKSPLSQPSVDLLLDFDDEETNQQPSQPQTLSQNSNRGFVQNHSVDDLVGLDQHQNSPVKNQNEAFTDIFGLFPDDNQNNKNKGNLASPSIPVSRSTNIDYLDSRRGGPQSQTPGNAKSRIIPPTSQSIDFSDFLMTSAPSNTPPPSERKHPSLNSAGGLASASMQFQPVFQSQQQQQQQNFQQFNNNNNTDIFGIGSFSPTSQNRGNQQQGQQQQQQQKQNNVDDDPFGFLK